MGDRIAIPKRGARWLHVVALAGWMAGMTLPAWAANNCPWMNEATASGLLGAEASGNYSDATASLPARCVFSEVGPQGIRALTITVGVDSDASGRIRELLQDCHDKPRAMRAIGNEALTCMVMHPHRVQTEFVAGRVRKQVFSISISSTEKNDPVLTPAMLKMKIETAAEQVAGNLF